MQYRSDDGAAPRGVVGRCHDDVLRDGEALQRAPDLDRRLAPASTLRHHDEQVPVQFLAGSGQTLRVLLRGHRIVNRARPDYHQEAVVVAVDDLLDSAATPDYGLRRAMRHRKLGVKRSRGDDFSDGADAKVLGRLHRKPLVKTE